MNAVADTTRLALTLDTPSRYPLRRFLSPSQAYILQWIAGGEEAAFAQDVLHRLKEVVDSAPTTGGTDGQGDQAIVRLHYFIGSYHWWITELDIEGGVDQAFGFACLDDPQCAELGYISIDELVDAGVGLDFHWQPVSLQAVKARLFERLPS